MRFLLNYEIHSASFIPASPYFFKNIVLKFSMINTQIIGMLDYVHLENVCSYYCWP